MGTQKTRDLVVGALVGLAGIVIGAVGTGIASAHVQFKQNQFETAIQSFKFESGDMPVEHIQLQQFVDAMRYLSFADADTVRGLASVMRKHPTCGNELSERCRAAYIESIQIIRKELGSGFVSDADIDAILSTKFETAVEAYRSLSDH